MMLRCRKTDGGLFEYLARRNIIAGCELEGRLSLLAARCVYLTEGRMIKLREARRRKSSVNETERRGDDDRYTELVRYRRDGAVVLLISAISLNVSDDDILRARVMDHEP